MTLEQVYQEIMRIVKSKSIRISENLINTEILESIKEVEQVIKNYCQIPRVPIALKYTWANMVIDLLLFQIESSTTPDDVLGSFDPSDVSKIAIGDTSISLGDKYRHTQRSRILYSHAPSLDDIAMNYRQQLNQFRRIY